MDGIAYLLTISRTTFSREFGRLEPWFLCKIMKTSGSDFPSQLDEKTAVSKFFGFSLFYDFCIKIAWRHLTDCIIWRTQCQPPVIDTRWFAPQNPSDLAVAPYANIWMEPRLYHLKHKLSTSKQKHTLYYSWKQHASEYGTILRTITVLTVAICSDWSWKLMAWLSPGEFNHIVIKP